MHPLRKIHQGYLQGRRSVQNVLDCLDAYESYLETHAWQAQNWAGARDLQLQLADAIEYLLTAADCLRTLVCEQASFSLFEKYMDKAERVLQDLLAEASYQLQERQIGAFYAC